MKPKKYDYIKICWGYPSDSERSRIIWRKWNGVTTEFASTKLFGDGHFYAIDVSKQIYDDQHLAPHCLPTSENGYTSKKVLTLNLKGEYFKDILNYQKLKEYREIKPYWTKRLFER
jgi:hypothetical protein